MMLSFLYITALALKFKSRQASSSAWRLVKGLASVTMVLSMVQYKGCG